MSSYYFNHNNIKKKEILPGIFQQVLSGREGKVMMVRYTIRAGAEFPVHHHPHEQVGIMLEGEADFSIGGEERHVLAGDGYVIPGNVEHGAIFTRDSVVIDVFHPPREDFL